jgi:hypothetical protein
MSGSSPLCPVMESDVKAALSLQNWDINIDALCALSSIKSSNSPINVYVLG